ncbi:hypothetical protein ZOSMA_16G00010 [Zostera marina]|uniref:Uncharacterized protein n=1 Tax=Zostera marina TaxID=29655 RepID=A0A0K9PUV6_ZOSMR|nr:hypothetical protein ZOSMA_16G00010 [Zostera marina]
MKILTALPLTLAPAIPQPDNLLLLSYRNNSIPTSPFPLRRISLCTRVLRTEIASAHTQPPLHVDEEELQLNEGFIEVGYICNVHGLSGELNVFPSTDFPQLRFCQPGKRWIRSRVMGKQVIQEVEFLGGRSHSGRKIWIVTIAGIDTVEKAKQMVGSTILVKQKDRPTLEDGDFYTPDLVGMRVVLKEDDSTVGTVISIVNNGSCDLLEVMPGSSEENPSITISEFETSGSFILIPFVKEIVPDIDMNKRVIQITPPKGLLELNSRSDSKTKKERSLLKWRQKKKLQQRVIAAKKKLIAMGQKHVLQGFSFGEKDAKGLLANQIADINFKLFQHAIRNIDVPSDRFNEFIFLLLLSRQ